MSSLENYIRSLEGPILVIGASGFIGANLFKKLSTTRQDVFAVVRKTKGWRLAEIKDDKIIAIDLNDFSAVRNLISNILPNTVFNCLAYGAYSFEKDTSLTYQTNFQSVVNLVELLSQRPISSYVHAGSSSEYGANCEAPSEDSACEPNSAYAVSKTAASTYLSYMGKHNSFPCVNLRLYSVYGPLEDTSRLIPNLLRKALQRDLPPFVNPGISRDFVHVDDVCTAFVIAAAKMHPDLYGENFNIGTGIKTSIRDLAELACKIFDIPVQPKFGSMEDRAWDLKDWYSNPSKALSLLGWSATITLDQGLLSTSKWIEKISDDDMRVSTKLVNGTLKKSISAIVACYKDADAIPFMYRRLTDTLKKLDIDYEIIFVNDGSPDNTAQVILDISKDDSRVIGITHSRNFGSQMAFRSGMELATKDSVVLLDGDLQDPPELITTFYEKYESGFDVVYGRRVKRDMPWYRGAFYKLFYRIFAKFSYIDVPLDAGDFSLMDRRVVDWLLSCPESDLFLRGLRAYIGFKQTGVDYIRPERMFGVTTNNFLKNIDWAKKGIFSFSNTPLTMLTTAGVIALGLSIVAAFTVALLRIFVPDIVPRGLTTILIAILLFGSFNIFAIGLVGEYVAKIMGEVKHRPRLIRSSLIRNGESTDLLPDGKGKKR
jgi:nucleoside-diphosphate-sugar epimerase/glycosyltransferase involved in cell wall biosynthesis